MSIPRRLFRQILFALNYVKTYCSDPRATGYARLLLWVWLWRNSIQSLWKRAQFPSQLFREGKREQAEKDYQAVLKKSMELAPADSRRGLILSELANYLSSSGQRAAAMDMFLESMAILEPNWRVEPIVSILADRNLFQHYTRYQQFEAAQKVLEGAFDRLLFVKQPDFGNCQLKKMLGDLDFLLSGELAYVFVETECISHATHYLKLAKARLVATRNGGSPSDRAILDCIQIRIFLSEQNILGARELCKKIESLQVSECRRVLAKVCLAEGNYEQTLILLEPYVDIIGKAKFPPPNSLDPMLDCAEGLFGAGGRNRILPVLKMAAMIHRVYQMPADLRWRKSLDKWKLWASTCADQEMNAFVDEELQKLPPTNEQCFRPANRFRIDPEFSE